MRALLTLVVLGILLGGGGLSAHAQAIENSPGDPVPTTVSAAIEQVTPDNVDPRFAVTTVDRSQSLFGRDPFLTRFDDPTEFGNAARISQTGNENLTVLRQLGQGNVASVRVLGDNNDISTVQEGSNNRLGLAVDGDFNTIPVTQIGVGHDLSLELTGSNLTLDQQVLFFDDGAPLNPLPHGIVQEGTGTIPLYIQVRRGN